jgi:hypothetical protein
MANPLDSLPPNVVEALRRGDKIGAIKLLREVARVGLAEAKNAIDTANRQSATHRPEHNPEHRPAAAGTPPHSPPPQVPAASTLYSPGLSPGEVPRTSGGMGFVIVVIIAVIAIWLFWKVA